MENMIHYAFILDQSGSMEEIKKEVDASFNEQVEAVKKLKRKNPDSKINIDIQSQPKSEVIKKNARNYEE